MKNLNDIFTGRKLRVDHYAQVPCKPFVYPVKNELHAYEVCNLLAHQHLFLADSKIIPDYSNLITVLMYDEAEGEWVDYWNETLAIEWEGVKEILFHYTTKPVYIPAHVLTKTSEVILNAMTELKKEVLYQQDMGFQHPEELELIDILTVLIKQLNI